MSSKNLPENIERDVEAIGKISIIDSLLEVVCQSTGMGFAAVARVTDDKWVACMVRDEISFGLKPGGELELKTTICNEIRQHQGPVVINQVSQDDTYRSHHTPAMYGFESYISYPIFLKNGLFFGTLCAIDPKPAELKNPKIMGMFHLFSELISFHLNALDELLWSQQKLEEEKKIAELREQFIAILGHDLRNPVSSIMMATELLSESGVAEENLPVIKAIKNSSYRMSGLINNMLDFASGKLGSGITLERRKVAADNLQKTLLQLTEELQTIWPDRIIDINIELNEAVDCDPDRIAQLYSNLLGNALVHGDSGQPVIVDVTSDKEKMELRITNAGEQIPESARQKLFQPFYRGEDTSGKKGLGLGLYIANEISRAHAGELLLDSTTDKTSFTFLLPAAVNISLKEAHKTGAIPA